MASILPPTDASVHQAARFLIDGELVALPTETVYGLAADARNPAAVAKIFEAKNRPATNPLIVHLDQAARVPEYAILEDNRWEKLAESFWPGPLTLILPRKGRGICDLVTAGLPTAGFRVPDFELTRRVLQEAGIPVAAPSANPSNYLSPTRAEHVQRSMGKRIQWILDGGPCQTGIESTILDLSQPKISRLLRPGPISPEQIEAVLGEPIEMMTTKSEGVQIAPGQLRAHYQPRARLILHGHNEHIEIMSSDAKTARVLYQKPDGIAPKYTFWLSQSANDQEAAHNLFRLLHLLDEKGFETVHVQKAPSTALGSSINDRLQRAAAKK